MEKVLYPSPKQDYKVLVKTITYNQAKYIQDTLNGVAMQQTNFPFVEVVIDDCSTDGEQEVIKSWLEANCDMESAEYINIPTSQVIIARHKTNYNCTFAIYLLKRNLWQEQEEKRKHFKPWEDKCEYIALCEGDDYWTDPLKLQKQADYLEDHPDYGMVHTKANVYVQEKNKIISTLGEDCDYRTILESYKQIVTLTVCIRASLYEKYNYDIIKDSTWKMGDLPLWIYLSHESKIHFINEISGTYRELKNSASHSSNPLNKLEFDYSSYMIRVFFAKLYNENTSCKRRITYYFTQHLIKLSILNDIKYPFIFWADIKRNKTFSLRLIINYCLSLTSFTRRLKRACWTLNTAISKKLCIKD